MFNGIVNLAPESLPVTVKIVFSVFDVPNKVFTVVGLKKLDQLAKNTTMNASWKKYKAQAKRDAPGLRDELAPVFGSERAGQMVKELQESNPASKQLPKGVEELIWYKFNFF